MNADRFQAGGWKTTPFRLRNEGGGVSVWTKSWFVSARWVGNEGEQKTLRGGEDKGLSPRRETNEADRRLYSGEDERAVRVIERMRTAARGITRVADNYVPRIRVELDFLFFLFPRHFHATVFPPLISIYSCTPLIRAAHRAERTVKLTETNPTRPPPSPPQLSSKRKNSYN